MTKTIPCRDLHEHWHCAKSTVFAVRATDPDYRELCREFEIGGIAQIFESDNDKYLARKLARAQAATNPEPAKRKVGRPRRASYSGIAAE